MKQQNVVATQIAALDAILSIPAKNFKHESDFGKPFTVNPKGECGTVASPGGWLAQHPHFRELGVTFEEIPLAGGLKRYMPMLDVGSGMKARGYAALSRVMGLDSDVVHKVLSPSAYPDPGAVTPLDVAKRLRGVILKQPGGKEALTVHEKAIKAHEKAQEKAEKQAKRAADKAKKAAAKPAKATKKVVKKAKKGKKK